MRQLFIFSDSVIKGVMHENGRYKLCEDHDFASLNARGIEAHNHSKMGATIRTGLDIMRRKLTPCDEETLVLLSFGGNDCDFDWKSVSDDPEAAHICKTPLETFKQKYARMLETIKRFGGKPVVLNLPPIDSGRYFRWISRNLSPSRILRFLKEVGFIGRWQEMFNIAAVQVASAAGVPVIDIRSAFLAQPDFRSYLCADGIHPNEQGAALIAGELYRTLTGNEAPKIVTEQPFPGKKSQWEGFDRYDFICNARKATVVVPRKVAEGHPWIWRPAFFGAFPSVDKALLEKGFHVVYYDLTHLYGSPRAQRLGTDFYDIMRRYYRLSSKVTLEGFSRGGLFAFNWGAKNPDKVACIYVDAPVCDVFSWPGRHRELWSGLLAEWGLTDEQMNNFKGNPIDNLEPLADAGIPVISVCGDSDRTVPYEENMKIVADRYRALGGLVEIILKPGCDHHPHSLENPEAVVDFIVRNQPD